MSLPDPAAADPSEVQPLMVLVRGRSIEDVPDLSMLPDLEVAVVTDHVVLLAVRLAASPAEAALALEDEVLGLPGGALWLLLCPTCDHPLGLGRAAYVCPEHGEVLQRPGRTPSQVRPSSQRPSRHRSRSAHKQVAMGQAWDRFLSESSDTADLDEDERLALQEAQARLQRLLSHRTE